LSARLAAFAALSLATPLAAQDTDVAPPAVAPAEVYATFDEVEVYDVVNDVWDSCSVLAVHKGAYRVACDGERSIRRDIHVRRPGGQPVGQTAAQPVADAPFKRGDIILASVMGLPKDWRLCVVMRNDVSRNNSYAVDCGSDYRVLPDWVRKDPKASP
jgi:hypothetical protein